MKNMAMALSALILMVMLLIGCSSGGGGSTPANGTPGGAYSISGKVATSGGAGIANVSMALSGAGSATAATDSNGAYSFTGLVNGGYTVMPSLTGYTCSPASRAVTVNGVDVTGQDFVGSVNGTAGSLRVRVVNSHSDTVPNVPVVLGDANGAMITSGATDANGEYIFSNPPANATVTTAMSCVYSGQTFTWYEVETAYDVNVSAVTLRVSDCDSASTSLGTITVALTDIPPGATYISLRAGDAFGSVSSIVNNQAQGTVTVYSDDLQSDGKVSITAVAIDSNGDLISYGLLSDQTVVSGMTVTIAASQIFDYIQYQVTNIPATVLSGGGAVLMIRKDGMYQVPSTYQNFSSAPTTTTLYVPYIPGLAEQFSYYVGLMLDQNSNGNVDSFISIGADEDSASPSAQTFDASQAATIPTDLSISAASGTATPTFSWSGLDTGASFISGNTNTQTSSYFKSIAFTAAPTRTSIVFPQLPDSLSVFRPTVAQNYSVSIATDSLFAGYTDYLTKMDQVISGSLTLPAGGNTYIIGGAYYSSTQTLAPVLKRNIAPAIGSPKKRLGM